jgi:hypothetical protein
MEESGEINLKGVECKTGLDLSPSRQGSMAQSCEHYYKRSCSVKSGYFLKNSDYQILKKNSAWN